MAKSSLGIGQELHGDNVIYRIESILGQGSFGITYKAKAFTVIKGKFGEELVETKTLKAIKEFFMKEVNGRDESGSITGMSEGSLSYNYAQKFKKEAENLAGMNHPNIVKIIDFINANNTYYYVMDYIDGENLNDYLKHHKMNEQEAVDTILEVAKALQYMHEEKHMLHLDLKPGNIMRRNDDGHIFLIDFGLSKHYNEEGQPDTSTTIGLGTEGYAPLEQGKRATAQNAFRPTIDVYALGGTLFKLLTCETPPSASDILNDEDILCEILRKYTVNLQLQDIIVKTMMPRAKDRMESITTVIKAIMQLDSDMLLRTDSLTSSKEIIPTLISQVNHHDENTVFSEATEEKFEFVDMGLSVKWAKRNLCAKRITGLGILCKGVVLDKSNDWNIIPQSFGGTSYDSATHVLGNPFRVPTRSEWKELIDNCKWKWEEKDGITGYIVTAKNGNSIFLPSASGYWSCTKGENKDFPCVYYLFFNYYSIDLIYNVYTTSRCIRPVNPQ